MGGGIPVVNYVAYQREIVLNLSRTDMVDQLRENFRYPFSNNFGVDLIISIKDANGASVRQ